ncbi:MAG: alpha/beta fold hydrolase [Bryobacterales bacterium]|nr:alpha/beta fold hydrolase [Bryobacterales bacterium]
MTKHLVLLVHGFGSSPETWDTLLKRFRADPALSGIEFDTYGYPTPWFNLNPFGRIPRLRELGEGLEARLGSSRVREHAQVTLAGHSQGGLVIQSCLAKMLSDERGDDLRRIRQIILIATPNLGSTYASSFRRAVSKIFPNPQERTLRALDPEISDLRREIERRIVDAKEATATECPIRTTCFWGLGDRIVLEASAKGLFEVCKPLEGDHFQVLDPKPEDYQLLAETILEPSGHRNVFELDRFEMQVTVEPKIPPLEIECQHGKIKRTVTTDNVARLVRLATFSRQNRCTEPFVLSYATRTNGFVEFSCNPPDNEAPGSELRHWEDHGAEATFHFTPKPGKTYSLLATVYKGYDAGERNVHFHMKRNRSYRHIHVRLDLRAYLKAGWVITQPPAAYFHPDDPKDHNLCKLRPLGTPHAGTSAEPGLFRWDFEDRTEGVIDVVWDVAA